MNARYSTYLIVLMSLAGTATAEGDREQIEGEWVAVSIKFGTAAISERAVKNSGLNIKGDECAGTVNGLKTGRFRLAVDGSKDPKELDLTPLWEGGGGVVKGVYKLDGDTLTICRPLTAEGARPKEFKPADGVGLGVFKRLPKK